MLLEWFSNTFFYINVHSVVNSRQTYRSSIFTMPVLVSEFAGETNLSAFVTVGR